MTTVPTPHLDGKHVVFGEVKSGKSVVRRIEELPTADGDRPRKAAAIADSGELTGDAAAVSESPVRPSIKAEALSVISRVDPAQPTTVTVIQAGD